MGPFRQIGYEYIESGCAIWIVRLASLIIGIALLVISISRLLDLAAS